MHVAQYLDAETQGWTTLAVFFERGESEMEDYMEAVAGSVEIQESHRDPMTVTRVMERADTKPEDLVMYRLSVDHAPAYGAPVGSWLVRGTDVYIGPPCLTKEQAQEAAFYCLYYHAQQDD